MQEIKGVQIKGVVEVACKQEVTTTGTELVTGTEEDEESERMQGMAEATGGAALVIPANERICMLLMPQMC